MKVAVAAFVAAAALAAPADDEWLSWTRSQAVAIGERAYVRGRVGGWFDTRMLKTERSYNYKLAATLLSPEVVRASARVIQLAERLSDEEGRALLGAAEAIPGIIVMVEIDPREGSGVMPNDWLALLRPVLRSRDGRTVRGVDTPALRNVRALNSGTTAQLRFRPFLGCFSIRSRGWLTTLPSGYRGGRTRCAHFRPRRPCAVAATSLVRVAAFVVTALSRPRTPDARLSCGRAL